MGSVGLSYLPSLTQNQTAWLIEACAPWCVTSTYECGLANRHQVAQMTGSDPSPFSPDATGSSLDTRRGINRHSLDQLRAAADGAHSATAYRPIWLRNREGCHMVDRRGPRSVVVIMRKPMAMLAAIGLPAIVAAGMAIAPAAANAAPAGAASCPQGAVCAWYDINFGGPMRILNQPEMTNFLFDNYNTANVNMNDTISSIVNNSDKMFRGWVDHDFQGLFNVGVVPHTQSSDLRNARYYVGGVFQGFHDFNDQLSSERVGGVIS
ncbi:peptidase inhibitor family I36 protein [Actinoplanes sp. TBRC 11911]|uniref:peptidase inhibitor family I36 protein n=1 Tax=Actinoplanes sp. TBRC 11911 TaxID=2729386 RepID=UPI0028A1D98A|nr:peptidase inhibitor family I36 protein [Actinoplanes sp. TBRC 11911]